MPRLLLASVIVLAAAAAGLAFYSYLQKPAAGGAIHAELNPPPGTRFLLGDGSGGIALSPDGKTVAFVSTAAGKDDLWVQPLGGSSARMLAGAEGAAYPFWSPDSKSIGYFADGKLHRIDMDGGMLTALCDVGTNPRGGAWTDDGRITFGTGFAGLQQVPQPAARQNR
jgi:hypothetical protein